MAKVAGYKGWKKQSEKLFKMFFRKIKVGEARIFKKGNKWVAQVWIKVGDVNEKLEESFETMVDARNWLNRQRRRISRSIFG